jgi:hypothetical protein
MSTRSDHQPGKGHRPRSIIEGESQIPESRLQLAAIVQQINPARARTGVVVQGSGVCTSVGHCLQTAGACTCRAPGSLHMMAQACLQHPIECLSCCVGGWIIATCCRSSECCHLSPICAVHARGSEMHTQLQGRLSYGTCLSPMQPRPPCLASWQLSNRSAQGCTRSSSTWPVPPTAVGFARPAETRIRRLQVSHAAAVGCAAWLSPDNPTCNRSTTPIMLLDCRSLCTPLVQMFEVDPLFSLALDPVAAALCRSCRVCPLLSQQRQRSCSPYMSHAPS